MVAQLTGLKPKEFIHTIGDAHIYTNHLEQVDLQLSREPFHLPTVELNKNITNINAFTFDDIKLIGYNSHEGIKGKVAV